MLRIFEHVIICMCCADVHGFHELTMQTNYVGLEDLIQPNKNISPLAGLARLYSFDQRSLHMYVAVVRPEEANST